MRLEFTLRRSFGHDRYYPANQQAHAVVALTGRKCLKDVEVARLQAAGFTVSVTEGVADAHSTRG